ncbi:GntR family transcriptional regulator, partial [Mycobacterium sp. ITM-2017-0098]
TVRRALDELNQRGLIETVHGKGSFVAFPQMRYDISGGRDASFTRSMQQLGHRVSIAVLSTDTVETSDLQAEL